MPENANAMSLFTQVASREGLNQTKHFRERNEIVAGDLFATGRIQSPLFIVEVRTTFAAENHIGRYL